MKLISIIFIFTVLVGSLNCTNSMMARESQQPNVTHGVAVGDVTHNRAVIWSRTDREGYMNVAVKPRQGRKVFKSVRVFEEDDFTGQISLHSLKANTPYTYKVWFSKKKSKTKPLSFASGKFRTAPRKNDSRAVKVTWSGDFAGQNVCRDAKEGFPIFNAINSEASDLFIGLGDMIYADNTCEATGRYGNAQVLGNFIPAADLENFWAHWKYSREDEGFKKLLSSTPYYGIWDDHEVVNDFGPLHDTRGSAPYTPGENLLPIGLKAFFDYTPVAKSNRTPNRLYRNIRWGKHLDLFFLDNRQYRDANLAADNPDRSKTMLGREQLSWLKNKLSASSAIWKVIVSSVPMSIPTGFPQNLGRDGWTNFDENNDPTVEGIPQSDTGFERELVAILETLREENANALFITTDVHFAAVFRYTPFDDTPSFNVHEVVIGPGNAGLFPNRNFDTTLGTESLFFFGPESANLSSWEEAKQWFNYGLMEIDKRGHLIVQVKNIGGGSEYSLSLSPNTK